MKKIRYLFFSVIGCIKLHKAEILSFLVALLIIAGYVSCYQIGKHIPEPVKEVEQEKEQEIIPDIFFICNVENTAPKYIMVCYTKNGESHYPHFAYMWQVISFINHLETLGEVDRNGYTLPVLQELNV